MSNSSSHFPAGLRQKLVPEEKRPKFSSKGKVFKVNLVEQFLHVKLILVVILRQFSYL